MSFTSLCYHGLGMLELIKVILFSPNFSVLLNSPQIFEKIFSDELIMDIIGSLECKFFYWLKIILNECTVQVILL